MVHRRAGPGRANHSPLDPFPLEDGSGQRISEQAVDGWAFRQSTHARTGHWVRSQREADSPWCGAHPNNYYSVDPKPAPMPLGPEAGGSGLIRSLAAA